MLFFDIFHNHNWKKKIKGMGENKIKNSKISGNIKNN